MLWVFNSFCDTARIVVCEVYSIWKTTKRLQAFLGSGSLQFLTFDQLLTKFTTNWPNLKPIDQLTALPTYSPSFWPVDHIGRKPVQREEKKVHQCTTGFHITFQEMEHFFLQINIVTSIFIENCWNLFYMIDNSQKIMPNIFFIKYDLYLQRYLQKTWRGRHLTLKFCVSTK